MIRISDYGGKMPPASIEDCLPDEYLWWCQVAIDRGAPPPRWTNPDQFLALKAEFPRYTRYVCKRELADMGLLEPEPLSNDWLEQFVATLAGRPDAVRAIGTLLRRASA